MLVYTSEPVGERENLEVTGPVALKLCGASSAPDTDFIAWLTDVSPSGLSTHVTEGILRTRFRDSWPEPKLPRVVPRFDRNTDTGNVPWEDTPWQIAHQTILDREHPSYLLLPII